MLTRLSLILVLLIAPLSAAKFKRIEECCELQIKTPALAERQTSKIRLANGLEALLISDPEADLSAAALAVEAGSWQDPLDRPGLAHYCEHMLFLGSAAYPSETGFRSYIDDRGGKFNAYTADRHTNYMFAITHADFAEAIDRFSHFFIDPSFTASALDREVNAVDQEFARTLQHDGWRGEMVRKTLSSASHPDSRFNIGNKETLGGTRSEEVRHWYEGHYSSDLMHLAIISPLPLDQLEQLAVEKFSRVPNRNIGRFEEPSTQIDPANLGSTVFVAPHMDRRELTLMWELPFDYDKTMESHAGQLISFVLGHEGPGSLTEQLKEEGLIEALSTGQRLHKRPESKQSHLIVSIDLTPKGLEQRDEVVAQVYEAIDLIAREGVPSYIHDEINQMARLGYEFQSRKEVFGQVSELTAAMIGEPLESFPGRTLVATSYDPKEVQRLTSYLTAEKALLFVTAPAEETGVQFDQTNPWTGVAYRVERLSDAQIALWSGGRDLAAVTMPGANPFIPRNLDLVYEGETDRTFPTPELLVSDEGGELYWALDRQFQVPELFARFEIVSAAVVEGDPRTAALLDLVAVAIQEELASTSYQARLGGLHYSLRPTVRGLNLTLGGYSERSAELAAAVAEQLNKGAPSEEHFLTYRDRLARSYRNFDREQPLSQGQDLLQGMIYQDHIHPSEKAQAIGAIEYSDLESFFAELTERCYLRALVYGSATKEDAEALYAAVQAGAGASPYPLGKSLHRKVVVLPEQRGPFYLEKQIGSQGNAAILAIQRGPFSFEARAAQQILAMGMETPFFDELRTKQQTGYVCHSWEGSAEDRLFQYFAVESTSHDSRDLLARFELMIEQFNRHLTDTAFPKERFETIQKALVERLQNPVSSQREMGELLCLLAFEKEADFDYLAKRIEATQNLSYERFTELSKEFLGKVNKGRLAILVSGNLPEVASLRYERIPSQSRLSRIASYIGRPADITPSK